MSIQMNTTGILPVGSGRLLLAAVSICETASAVLVETRSAFSAIDTLTATIAGLPSGARGQVFIEVATAAEVVELDTPELVTVAWLTRESRTGRPGTGENCRIGEALNRAVGAWVSEMVTGDAETDGDELTVGFFGPEVLFADLRDDIVARTATPAASTDSESVTH